jgi:hypothetical protein
VVSATLVANVVLHETCHLVSADDASHHRLPGWEASSRRCPGHARPELAPAAPFGNDSTARIVRAEWTITRDPEPGAPMRTLPIALVCVTSGQQCCAWSGASFGRA